MTRRGRRVVPALAVLGVALFAGRWTAGLLSDRWWAEEVAPPAVDFITGWHLLRLTLEIGGILIASAWFIGHLVVVYRAIGSVQVSRRVANLEIREALTPRLLLTATVLVGAVLGLIVGSGKSGWAPAVALAWHGVTFDLQEPVLGHDAGLYVAQLPLWRLVHGFFLALTVGALVIGLALYSLVGALRWVGGRPAISDHARAHIGWLLVAFALALAWGYLLEPYELVAGITGVPDRAAVDLTALVSPALTGTALMVAVMSAVWALRPRHALVAAGWLVLVITSLGGHLLLPAFSRGTGAPVIEPAVARQFAAEAFGLGALRDSANGRLLRDTSPPRLAPLWGARAVLRLGPVDSADSVAADPAVLTVEGRRLPAWLLLRERGPRATVAAIAATRVAATGDPLYYRIGDTLAYPTPHPYTELGEGAVRPGAPPYYLTRSSRGVALDEWSTRLVLAWSLQLAPLLGNGGEGTRVVWRLSPRERVSALLPAVEWGAPMLRLIDNEVVWLCDGYVTAATFPLVERLPWRNRAASLVRPGFLGVVHAESGETRLYLRPDAGPLAQAWAGIAGGVARPASEIPGAIAAALPYPAEGFATQARALERAPWDAGVLSGRPESGPGEPNPPEPGWRPDTGGTRLTAVYERPAGRRVSAVLAGSARDGRLVLELVRQDSAATLQAPRALEATWRRFPSFERLLDSVRQSGVRFDSLVPGALTLWRDGEALGAYRSYFAPRFGGNLALVWVAVAQQGRRLGAGRTLQEAWQNLRGVSAPAPPAAPSATFEEARRWLRLADSALRLGDWAAFGRAFDALKQVLGGEPDSTKP